MHSFRFHHNCNCHWMDAHTKYVNVYGANVCLICFSRKPIYSNVFAVENVNFQESPSQTVFTCFYSERHKKLIQFFSMPFSVASARFWFTDSVCLICYISTGHLIVYSLPSLRQLMDIDFLPLADLRYFSLAQQKDF